MKYIDISKTRYGLKSWVEGDFEVSRYFQSRYGVRCAIVLLARFVGSRRQLGRVRLPWPHAMASEDIDSWCARMLGTAAHEADCSPDKKVSAAKMSIDEFLDMPFASSERDAQAEVSEEQDAGASVEVAAGQPPEWVADGPAQAVVDGDFVERDSVYRHWAPHIRKPLSPLMEMRGAFQRDVVRAALFDGMGQRRRWRPC